MSCLYRADGKVYLAAKREQYSDRLRPDNWLAHHDTFNNLLSQVNVPIHEMVEAQNVAALPAVVQRWDAVDASKIVGPLPNPAGFLRKNGLGSAWTSASGVIGALTEYTIQMNDTAATTVGNVTTQSYCTFNFDTSKCHQPYSWSLRAVLDVRTNWVQNQDFVLDVLVDSVSVANVTFTSPGPNANVTNTRVLVNVNLGNLASGVHELRFQQVNPTSNTAYDQWALIFVNDYLSFIQTSFA